MGVPTSEVGYTPAMPRREDHEVHKGYVVALGGKNIFIYLHTAPYLLRRRREIKIKKGANGKEVK